MPHVERLGWVFHESETKNPTSRHKQDRMTDDIESLTDGIERH